jgi:hypothetical protein
LTEKNEPKKITIDLAEFDLSKIFRVGDKVIDVLNKKIKNPIERYLVLKLLCISEEANGFVLSTEDEAKLREMARDESLDDEKGSWNTVTLKTNHLRAKDAQTKQQRHSQPKATNYPEHNQVQSYPSQKPCYQNKLHPLTHANIMGRPFCEPHK